MIDSEMSFEVVATSPVVAEQALKKHIEKLSSLPRIEVSNVSYGGAREVKFSDKIPKAYSVVATCRVRAPSFYDFLNIIMVYGPSSIEILEPESLELGIAEMQNIANVVAGLVHKFAEAGIGGLVINSEG